MMMIMMRIRHEADDRLQSRRESGCCGIPHQVNVVVIMQCSEIICFNNPHQDGGPLGFPSASSEGEWITGRRSPGGWEV